MNTEAIFSQDGITAVSSQIQQLKTLFPACFDKDGRFLIDKFQAEITQQTDISREFYAMNWLGKSYARLLRNLPPETLISEDKTHNAKPENAGSQNLLIRGDNLEVLKHLKNAYAGSVKMIYIDPPYNTGSDGFVYQDDRKFTPTELARLANIDEDEAARILDFADKGSNSHSAWLTFMYPRLYIARELLKDDGVIFISIDDNEAAQLKLLCDEVFGEGNFVGAISWESKTKSQNTKDSFNKLQPKTEYIWLYTKKFCRRFNLKITGKKDYPEKDEKGEFRYSKVEEMDANSIRGRDTMIFPILGIMPKTDKQWKIGKNSIDEYIKRGDVLLISNKPTIKMRPFDERREVTEPFWGFLSKDIGTAESAKQQLTKILDGKHGFDTVKPIELIKKLIFHSTDKNSLILDFFAGSGTTAHAVMQLNAEEQNGSRRYICVQLPEKTDEKSEARKAGYPTIFDITKARIEKAAAKIRAEHPDYTGDLGFKIFQTVEHFRQHQDNDFSPDQMDFPFNDKLSEEQLQTLLTTWTLYDGAALTTPVEPVRLGDYTAYLCEKRLYLLNKGFTSADLLAFIKKLDDDADFNPNRVIVFGSNMASAMQHELDQAVRGYTNKKEIELNVIIRV